MTQMRPIRDRNPVKGAPIASPMTQFRVDDPNSAIVVAALDGCRLPRTPSP